MIKHGIIPAHEENTGVAPRPSNWELFKQGWSNYEGYRPDGASGSVGTATTSHLFHLIMTVLTGGIWLIVWFFAAAHTGNKRHRQLVQAIQKSENTP